MSRWAAGSWLAALLVLAGCATPKPLVEVERRSIEALQNYHANAEMAVEATLAALRKSERLRLAAAARQHAREKAVAGALPLAEFDRVVELVAEKLAAVEAEEARFRGAWREAGEEFARAVKLREQVHRWLSRPGIGPEEIDAAGRALADEIRRAQPAGGVR